MAQAASAGGCFSRAGAVFGAGRPNSRARAVFGAGRPAGSGPPPLITGRAPNLASDS
jgi:hypothetical protein